MTLVQKSSMLDDYTWSRVTVPPLTVIDQPAYCVGQKAAALLIDRLENPGKPIASCKEPLQLIRRQSF